MSIYDITGEIRNGMWNYEPPFPKFNLLPLGEVPWAGSEVFCEIFDGLHSQTGTYLETPAHFFGNENSYAVTDIPIEKLVNIPCTLLMLGEDRYSNSKRRIPITEQMLENCLGSNDIEEGSAIIVGAGWGKHWMDEKYLSLSPYFTLGAIRWLISKKPFILGSDIPRWENLEKPEGFFPEFFAADILMLAPCVNLENLKGHKFNLTALPLNIPGTSCIPCRAVLADLRSER